MKVITEIESVNLSNGDRTRRIVGDGESRIERSRGYIDELRIGPGNERIGELERIHNEAVDRLVKSISERKIMHSRNGREANGVNA